MLTVTSAQINAWLAMFMFPLARILALLATSPPFNYTVLPRRVRLMVGLALGIVIAPLAGDLPAFSPASGAGLLCLAQQVLIGAAMGFSMRLVFTAVDLAGNVISTQMGLGFATNYDPANASDSPMLSELIGIIALLFFFAINGHQMILVTLVESFRVLPIGAFPKSGSWLNLAESGLVIFSSGIFLSLPIVVGLMMTNMALAILGRVAPQLNPMAIGFPVTITLGFSIMYVVMPYLGAPFERMFEQGLASMLSVFVR